MRAAFSPDGQRVVTASWDETARVWDVGTDPGTLPDWERTAERSPFVLNEQGALGASIRATCEGDVGS